MFNPNQQYPAPQMGGMASPIMAAMLQKYMMNKANPQSSQQMPNTPGQTMGMIQGNSQNWNSSMPQQGLLSNPSPSPQVYNGN